MKRKIRIFVFALPLLLFSTIVPAQQNITIVTPLTAVAEGLDLYAVGELFRDSKSLEEFEAALNNPDVGINNLDLDRDGYVDYIRVVEQVVDYRHEIILQVPFRANEFQDIATIEIEKIGYDAYRMHIRGCATFYGPDYYFSIGYTRAYHWPIVSWIFRPVYRPYRSVFYFGYYPHWWKPYRHVTVYEYQNRSARNERGEIYYRNRAERFDHGHEGDHKHWADSRRDRHGNREYAAPEPDRSIGFGRPYEQREERRSVTPQMRTPEKKDIGGERIRTNKPDSRKDENFRKEARQSDKPAVTRTPDSRGDENKTFRQRVERRSTVDQDNKRATVKEKRIASR